MIVEGDIDDVSITSATLNVTENLLNALEACDGKRRLTGGGVVIRCANANALFNLEPGRYRFDVRLNGEFNGGDNTRLRGTVF